MPENLNSKSMHALYMINYLNNSSPSLFLYLCLSPSGLQIVQQIAVVMAISITTNASIAIRIVIVVNVDNGREALVISHVMVIATTTSVGIVIASVPTTTRINSSLNVPAAFPWASSVSKDICIYLYISRLPVDTQRKSKKERIEEGTVQ